MEDRIIDDVRTVTATPPANETNPDMAALLERDWTGHGLSTHYLAGTASLPAIRGQFNNLLAAMAFPDELVGDAAITVTISWDNQPDVDLHVYEPGGGHVFYQQQQGQVGELDRDDTDGAGPENDFAECENLQPGEYGIGLNYCRGSAPKTVDLSVKAGPVLRERTYVLNTPRGSAGDNPSPVASIRVDQAGDGEFDFSVNGLCAPAVSGWVPALRPGRPPAAFGFRAFRPWPAGCSSSSSDAGAHR